MDIKDGLKLKGFPAEIPDCSRDDLPKFFKSIGYMKGVEVGVYKAEYTELFGKEGLTIYGIDPWMPYADFDIQSENRADRQNVIYDKAKRRVAPYPSIHLVRGMSMDVVESFEDRSLDFVYIDGNHKFRYVAEDMTEWWKKLKKGGFLCGHDYIHPRRIRGERLDNMHVPFVVDAFVLAYQIRNWWVLGRREPLPSDRRDRFRSWMIRK